MVAERPSNHMKVPDKVELQHMQLQAMLRDNNIHESELLYCGKREYTTEYTAHPEYHGKIMPWYLIGGEYEVPVCDIQDVESVQNE